MWAEVRCESRSWRVVLGHQANDVKLSPSRLDTAAAAAAAASGACDDKVAYDDDDDDGEHAFTYLLINVVIRERR